MKYKDPITGELRDVIIKSGDTLPIGTIVDFDGDVIPDGYEEATEASDVVNSLEGNEIYRAPSVKAVNEVLNGDKPMGSIVVEDITCKNILPNNIESQVINGVTITRNNDGSLTFNGTTTAYTKLEIVSNLELDSGAYTFYFSEKGTVSGNFFGAIRDENSGVIGKDLQIHNSITINKFSLTEAKRVTITVALGTNTTVTNFKIYPMLEKGSTATGYVEHKEYDNENLKGKVLWTNPDPTASMGYTAGGITLSSSDYDELEFWYYNNTANSVLMCAKTRKGGSAEIFYMDGFNGKLYSRVFTRVYNYLYTINACYSYGVGITPPLEANTMLIPAYIVGYKNRIIEDDSTSTTSTASIDEA